MKIPYAKICDTVSLYSDSTLNETGAIRKIVYDVTAIRKNKNKLTLTLNAHRADGSGMPFMNTQDVTNLSLTSKLEQIGSTIDHYYIKLRPGYIDENDNIVYTGDEEQYDIGRGAAE